MISTLWPRASPACFSLRVEYSLVFLDRIAMFIGVGSIVFTRFFLQRKSSSFLLIRKIFFCNVNKEPVAENFPSDQYRKFERTAVAQGKLCGYVFIKDLKGGVNDKSSFDFAKRIFYIPFFKVTKRKLQSGKFRMLFIQQNKFRSEEHTSEL